MRSFFLLLSFTSTSLALDPRSQFESFKLRANRTYSGPAEEEMRFSIFQENLRKMEKHNSEGHSWTMGVTKFADLTKYEINNFLDIYLHCRAEFVSSYASGRVSFPQGPSLPRTRDVRLEELPGTAPLIMMIIIFIIIIAIIFIATRCDSRIFPRPSTGGTRG